MVRSMITRSRIFISLAWLLCWGKRYALATPALCAYGTRIGIGVLGLSATMALSGCSRGANLNVINRSTADLTNVVATGSGFTRSIGSIPAGEQRNVSVSPSSESGLQLEFDVFSLAKPQLC